MRFIGLFFAFFIIKNANAQNYFANSDFEQLNICSELKQNCTSEAWFYLKPSATPLINNIEVPNPFRGKDLLILPIENVFKKISKRSFVYTMFCCPLTEGKLYTLSFYINTTNNKFEGLDFYFSPNEFVSSNFKNDSILPSIHIDSTDLKYAYEKWRYVETTYKANGKEKYCYLGNLSRQAYKLAVSDRMNRAGDVFYFIDDISFKSLQPEKLCNDYQKNINKLYAQNNRHSEGALVNNEANFIKDTILIPSIFFENDKAIIKQSFKKELIKIVEKLKNKNIAAIEIEGHTDNNGNFEHNKILSDLRAIAVKNIFVEVFPKSLELINTMGKADSEPIADNRLKEGRAKNRRVQIVVSYLKE